MGLRVVPVSGQVKKRVAIAISGQSSLEICRMLVLNYAPGSDYEIALVATEVTSQRCIALPGSNSLMARVVRKTRARVFGFVLWLEKYLAVKTKITPQLSPTTLADLNVPVKSFTVVGLGPGVIRYSPEDTALLASFKIDVLVHLNSAVAIVDGNPTIPLEQLSLRAGDSSLLDSIEALCFESVNKRRPTVEAKVLAHENPKRRAHLFGQISVPAKWLTTITIEAFQAKACYLVHSALSNSEELRSAYLSPGEYPKIATPTARTSIWQFQRTVMSLVHRLLSQAVRSEARWHVAYSFKSQWENLKEEDLTVIPNPKERFYADPFLVAHEGKTYCFVEDYGENVRKGRITVLELTPKGHRFLGTALEEDFHLSFPFIFKHGHEIYMCPETAGAGQIRLYRALGFPLSWTLDRVLMDNVSAADTVIFRRKKEWWMLTNLSPEGGPNHQSELHIFSAANLRTDDWRPHPLNPLVNDASRARNAGLIVRGEDVFRAFQLFDFDAYGAGLGIGLISKLDKEAYIEEVIREMTPSTNGLKGMHTISVGTDVLVTDVLFQTRKLKSSTVWSQALTEP